MRALMVAATLGVGLISLSACSGGGHGGGAGSTGGGIVNSGTVGTGAFSSGVNNSGSISSLGAGGFGTVHASSISLPKHK
jgi:hypothetical protein